MSKFIKTVYNYLWNTWEYKAILMYLFIGIYFFTGQFSGLNIEQMLISSFTNKIFLVVILYPSFVAMFLLTYQYISKNYNLLFIIILLGIKMYQERKKIHYYFQRFLLERFLKKYQFKKTIIVPSEQAFKRDCSHILKIKNRYKTEQEYLDDKYYKSIL